MTTRNDSLAPPILRYLLFRNVADLAQFPSEKLPEGARAVVEGAIQGSNAFAAPSQGNQEFVFTRIPSLGPLAFGFNAQDGVFDTTGGNAIQTRDGMWIRWPQLRLVALNGTTPVVVTNIANQLGTAAGGTTFSNIWAHFSRRVAGTANGHVVITAGITDNTATEVTLVSDEANDNGSGVLSVYPLIRQRNQ